MVGMEAKVEIRNDTSTRKVAFSWVRDEVAEAMEGRLRIQMEKGTSADVRGGTRRGTLEIDGVSTTNGMSGTEMDVASIVTRLASVVANAKRKGTVFGRSGLGHEERTGACEHGLVARLAKASIVVTTRGMEARAVITKHGVSTSATDREGRTRTIGGASEGRDNVEGK